MPATREIRARRGILIGLFTAVCGVAWVARPAAGQERSPGSPAPRSPQSWRGVHLMSPGHGGVPLLQRAIIERLAPMGVNLLILEVNYQFRFASHPELRSGDLSIDDARDLAATCRQHHIRLVPMFNCLGHQSWARTTFPLLVKHPELDESPQTPKDNQGIYCRSWCPLHPDVNTIVFALIDELIDAFRADAFHVGMDEVFLIGESGCMRCRGKDRAELFAKAVNDLHRQIVGQRKLTMWMWADRLLDDEKLGFGYGKWEASRNGTGPAIDRIPKDIILCDWHYETRPKGYPSVAYLQQKGFRMMPATWWNKDAALAMLRQARAEGTERMIGHLCTTWIGADAFCRAVLDDQPPAQPKPKAKSRRGGPREIVAALKACMAELQRSSESPRGRDSSNR